MEIRPLHGGHEEGSSSRGGELEPNNKVWGLGGETPDHNLQPTTLRQNLTIRYKRHRKLMRRETDSVAVRD